MPTAENLTISIVTYRRKNILKKCLTSILSQNYKPKYIIIIDNHYKKSAYELCKTYKNKLKIKYYCEPSKNIAKARNLAISKCNTPYMAFIDDDCLLTRKWTDYAYKITQSNSKLIYFQGGVIFKKTSNKLIKAQQKTYKNWIDTNNKKTFYDPIGIDTKNLIFNIRLVKENKLSFDPNFPIFEDTDFGLKIKKIGIEGKYIKDMRVYHQESKGFLRTLKKFYFRGKTKYFLNQKWCNFDSYSPMILQKLIKIIKEPDKFYINILDLIFSIGYKIAKNHNYSPKKNKIYIINHKDKAANEERARAVSEFLNKNKFETEIVDSQVLFQKITNSWQGLIIDPSLFILYRVLRLTIYKLNLLFLKPYLFYLELIFRGKCIRHYLYKNHASMTIIQYPMDLTCGIKKTEVKLIYDLPTIYSEELESEYNFPNLLVRSISTMEKKVFNKNFPTSFHWYSFLSLAKKNNKLPKNNYILNWGCDHQRDIAKINNNPKIIYLGNLNSPWIYPQLLEKIQKISPTQLDVYSYENPSREIYKSLKTKGFMKNLSDLSKYQFGLLTFTNDELRNNGFSAKHMLYMSYGLPVLCPEWRKDKVLSSATIYYNENNFNYLIKKYSQKKYWQKKHLAAIELSQKLNWDKTLQPLLPIIYKLQNEI